MKLFQSAAITVFSMLVICGPAGAQQREIGGIAAVINDKVITKSEYQEAKKANEQMIRATTPPGTEQNSLLSEASAKALDQLIDRTLILQEFEKVGGEIKPQMLDEDLNKIITDRFGGDKSKFLDQLKQTGLTQAKFRDLRSKMISEDIMRRQHSRTILFATPKQVRAFYDKNVDRFRTVGKMDVSMITLAKASEIPGVTPEMRKKLSEEIYAKLKKGADFAAMAKKLSDDPMAEKGGRRGVIDTSGSTFRKDLTGVAFSLKTGEISQPVEDNYNYYIIKANKRIPGAATSFDDPEVRKTCEAGALNELRNESVETWLKHLKKHARIKKVLN
jgi:peptidyl-prolyl cis-trans isomerase SurA